MISLSLTVVVRAALNNLASSQSAFNAAFEASGLSYPTAQLTSWYNSLFPSASASTIAVGIRYSPAMQSKASVWIDDTDSPFGSEPLGGFIRWGTGGKALIGGLRQQTATVYVYHASQELCTVLWTALQAQLALYVTDMQEAGYLDFRYTGGGPLTQIELASNGWMDVYIRTLSYNTLLMQQTPDNVNPVLYDRDLSVLPEGAVSPDGIEGAVVAATVE